MSNCSRNSCLSAGKTYDGSDFPDSNGRKGPQYLAWVSNIVSTNKDKRFVLKNPAGATLRIADLDDTIYRDRKDEVDGWGKFYLPKTVDMRVVGVVEDISCPCDQLVLMTCEDKKMYVYDGEDLHLVASSLVQLRDRGIEYPASKSYYHGEAFKDMTKEDWAKVRAGPVGKRLDQEHRQLVKSMTPRLLANLRLSRQRARLIS
ncbi:uncharacterized protein LOC121191556 [Toxotes jaculatrix]|uniref:uncharacterized protein LOC121191556 n=1 Tax=Toxotes jaculatrix TaxID=941984 RepID=UPI001B3AED6A|nr:uncharacterized protein LOC121191556 [Toxotes jaculatrix]XP_040908669.1 uncharacterized protein LOC121191556 [Toxotes jaculatrix]